MVGMHGRERNGRGAEGNLLYWQEWQVLLPKSEILEDISVLLLFRISKIYMVRLWKPFGLSRLRRRSMTFMRIMFFPAKLVSGE